MKRETRHSCNDVLEAFALEPGPEKATLEKYLRNYPEYAEAILDFATEIEREDLVRKEPFSTREHTLIVTSWEKHVKAASKMAADPFAALSGMDLGKIAIMLKVPKQVLTALRDRTIVATSVPKRFAQRLAAEIHSDLDTLMAFIASPPILSVVRSRKSDSKPRVVERKTFEQVLNDAGVAPELRKELMAED